MRRNYSVIVIGCRNQSGRIFCRHLYIPCKPLEKYIWTGQDFENMGWHDCKLFAISFGDNFQLLFDIDYIFKWVQTGKTFKFWMSPFTLVFENVYDLEFQMDGISGGIDIDEISRDHPQNQRTLTLCPQITLNIMVRITF